MIKHIFITIAICLIVVNTSLAQRKIKEMDADKQVEKDKARAEENKVNWQDKISFGGNLGASFGTGFSSILLQPMVFYKVAEKTSVGGGFTYIRWSQKFEIPGGTTQTFSDNVFGLNVFARQLIFNPLFVHAEYNPMNFSQFDPQNQVDKRVWINSFFLGGGLQQDIGDRGGYYIMVLYDVLWNPNRSFYPSPYDIRMGFFF